MKRNKIMDEARQLIDRDKHPLEWLIEEMENDSWNVKLYRWFRLQWWILYCYIFNNRIARKIKFYSSSRRNIS